MTPVAVEVHSLEELSSRFQTARHYGHAAVGLSRWQHDMEVKDTKPIAGIADSYKFDQTIQLHFSENTRWYSFQAIMVAV